MQDLRIVERVAYGASVAERVTIDDAGRRRLKERYIAFDTETTGLDPEKDRILEVGAVLFEEGKPVQTFQSYVNPDVVIPAKVSELNHITAETVSGAPGEAELLPELLSFLGDCASGDTMICGHVTAFDLSFLCVAMERHGLSAAFKFVDTRQLAVEIPELTSHSLAAAADYFGISHENAHHALDDAMVTGLVLSKMLESNE